MAMAIQRNKLYNPVTIQNERPSSIFPSKAKLITAVAAIALGAIYYARSVANTSVLASLDPAPVSWTQATLLHYYSSPGIVNTIDGSASCELATIADGVLLQRPELLFDRTIRKTVIEACVNLVAQLRSGLTTEQMNRVNQECPLNACNAKGFEILYPKNGQTISLALNAPQKEFYNHKTALDELFNSAASRPFPLYMNATDIIASLQKFHSTLFQDTKDASLSGKFRTQSVLIFSEDRDNPLNPNLLRNDPNGGKSFSLRKGASSQEIKIVRGIEKKLKIPGALDKRERFLSSLTKEEATLFHKWCTLPIEHEKIEDAMQQFADDLLTKSDLAIEKKMDPIALAAWAHQKIIEIHPFLDGNGRLARAWMNIILTLNGIHMFVFPNNSAYTTASQQLNNPQAFEKLLLQSLSGLAKPTDVK